MAPPFLPAAELPVSVTSVRVTVLSEFSIAPPSLPSAFPFRNVMSESVREPTFAGTWKILSFALPSMIVVRAPAPMIVSVSVISRSPSAASSSPELPSVSV